jgi:hypothetical protein
LYKNPKQDVNANSVHTSQTPSILTDSNVLLSTCNYSHSPALITPSSQILPISRRINHTHIPHPIRAAAPTAHITCSVDAKLIAPAFFFTPVGPVGVTVTVIVDFGIVVVIIGPDEVELLLVDEVVEKEFVADEEESVVGDAVMVWDCD